MSHDFVLIFFKVSSPSTNETSVLLTESLSRKNDLEHRTETYEIDPRSRQVNVEPAFHTCDHERQLNARRNACFFGTD